LHLPTPLISKYEVDIFYDLARLHIVHE